MAEFRVTAACIVVPICDARVLVERGGLVDRRVPLDLLERLVAKGMVEAVPEPEPTAEQVEQVEQVEPVVEPAEPEQAEPEQVESEQVESEPVSSRKSKAAPAASE